MKAHGKYPLPRSALLIGILTSVLSTVGCFDKQIRTPGEGYRVRGNLENYGYGVITGWAARSPSDPPLKVKLLLVSKFNEVQIAITDASLPRPDVEEATGLEGKHGFSFEIDSAINLGPRVILPFDGQPHQVRAFAQDPRTRVWFELDSSPRLLPLHK